MEDNTSKVQLDNLLNFFRDKTNTSIIFTKTNADTDSRVINKMIDKYVKNHSDKAIAYTSLGQLRYLSVMKHMDGIVGNSSSGLLEAPSFKIGTVNIGERQMGRETTNSVVNCKFNKKSIVYSINKILNMIPGVALPVCYTSDPASKTSLVLLSPSLDPCEKSTSWCRSNLSSV